MSQSLSFSFEFSGLYSRGSSRGMLGTEPATWFILWKEVPLKISQIPQEKTPTQVFYCEICEVFHNTYFEERERLLLWGEKFAVNISLIGIMKWFILILWF